MSSVVHAVTMNGKVSTVLMGKDGRSVEEEIVHRLRLLDGVKRFSLMLWRVPPGVPFDRVDLRSFPIEYIQCAGGESGRFICEVREGGVGAGTQCALGRVGGPAGEETVSWNGCSSTVRANEVLDVDEVAEAFIEYLRSGGSLSSWACRKLDLS